MHQQSVYARNTASIVRNVLKKKTVITISSIKKQTK